MSPLIPLDGSRYRRKDEVVAREVEALTPYPFTSVTIPGLADEDYAELLESVRAEGVRPGTPLVVTPDGRVVDGRARLRAAKQAGIPTVPTQVLEARTEADYAVWAAREAVARRHLTSEQRFALLQAALAILEAQGRANQRATQFRPKAKPPGGTLKEPAPVSPGKDEPATVVANWPPPHEPAGRTREKVARMTGVSSRQAGRMIAIATHGSPGLQEAVTAGRISVHRAYQGLREPGKAAPRPRQAPAPRAASPGNGLAALADQPVKTLNTVAALIIQWVEELPGWPEPRREPWWRALQNVSDSCELAFRRLEQLQEASDTAQAPAGDRGAAQPA